MAYKHILRYYFHDFETGGLDPDSSILTYYAAVTDENFNIVREIDLKFRPPGDKYVVTPYALRTNKINIEEHNKTATDQEKCVEKIKQFITLNEYQKPIMYTAGHNVHFDNEILKRLISAEEFRRHFEKHLLDTGTLAVAHQNAGKLPKRFDISLVKLAEHFKIDTTGAHESKNDVRMTIEVMKCLLRELSPNK